MNDNLIIIIVIIVSTVIGAYLGMLFNKLKEKGEKSTLIERQNQLNATISELKETISNLKLERDTYRDEREGLNIELVQKNTEYKNLHQLNLKRDEELEERQEQLRKDAD